MMFQDSPARGDRVVGGERRESRVRMCVWERRFRLLPAVVLLTRQEVAGDCGGGETVGSGDVYGAQ